jgi:hypothetical protein
MDGVTINPGQALEQYVDKIYRINDRAYSPDTHFSSREIQHDNGELNTAKYIAGRMMSGKLNLHDVQMAQAMIEALSFGDEVIMKHRSHDNLVAIQFLLAILPIKRKLSLDPKRLYQPRWWILFQIHNGNSWAKLLMPIVHLSNLYTCLMHYKVRNKTKIVKTDSEYLLIMLHLVVTNSHLFRLSGWVCNKLLIKRFGAGYLSVMAKLFYSDPRHPVRVSWEEVSPSTKWWNFKYNKPKGE